jgi:hypothetical protein
MDTEKNPRTAQARAEGAEKKAWEPPKFEVLLITDTEATQNTGADGGSAFS